jgi:hypothetical protein
VPDLVAVATSPPTASSYLPYLVAVIAALLGGGGLTTLFRSRGEGPKLLVDAAQGAVVVQTAVMQSLRTELGEARTEIAQLRADLAAANRADRDMRELQHDQEMTRAANTRLEGRVRWLRERNAQLAVELGRDPDVTPW